MTHRLPKGDAERRQDVLGAAIGVLAGAHGFTVNREVAGFWANGLTVSLAELAENLNQGVRIESPKGFRQGGVTGRAMAFAKTHAPELAPGQAATQSAGREHALATAQHRQKHQSKQSFKRMSPSLLASRVGNLP